MTERPSRTSTVPIEPVAARASTPFAEDADALLDRLEAAVAVWDRSVSPVDAAALHAVAVHAARGRGAFEVAIGEGLDLLLRRGGLARLGASGVGDLAREKLGMKEAEGRRLRRNAVKLRSRPLLRAAILSGEVTSRKAEVVLDGAPPGDDAYWTRRATMDTVRTLEAAVALGPGPPEEDWHLVHVSLPPEGARVVEAALELARFLLGPTSSFLCRFEALLMEFLGEFALEPKERPWWQLERERAQACLAGPADRGRGAGPADVERGRGSPALAAGGASTPDPQPFDPHAVLAGLQELVRARERLDERLRRACLLVRRTLAWQQLPFRNFAAWCAEGLGLSPRTVRQHVSLERRLQELPPLREAVRTRRLNLEQARQVARHATRENVQARIEEAAASTVIATRRQADAELDRRMWDARELRLSLPERVGELFQDALRAGRHHFPGLGPGEILVRMAAHFVLTWQHEVMRILAATDRVILRDGGLCQIPGCSRPAEHVHHIWFRSLGGPDEEWNCISLCAPHHLHGVHAGHVRIAGRAPDELAFLVGEVEVARGRAGLGANELLQVRSW
jgi:hypothetical protein